MEFRAYATHETASAVERLMASQADAQIRRAREALEAAARALDTTVAPVGADDEVRDLVQRLEAAAGIAVQRVQQEAQTALEAVRGELATARRENDEIGALVASLRGELATQTDRASTAEGDLDATIEAHRQIEMELAGMRELLEATRTEAARVAMDLEAENAQRAILTADLAVTRETQARLEAALAAAEATAAEDADVRTTLAGELDTARARLDDLEDSRTALHAELEASRSALAAAETERDAAQATLVTAAAEQDATRSTLAAAESDLAASRAALTAAESDLAASQTALTAAEGDLGASQAALTAAEAARDRPPLIEAAATACRELTAVTSVNDLLGALVSQVSTQFTRTAIFRAKAHHLEGEHAVGFDAATDVSKLVVPLTLDSILTRAYSSGTLARLGPGDTPGGAAPFADSPHLAVAVPIAFQGEVLAVLYADAEDPPAGRHDERPAFAAILADQATLLLARMSQELKALHELGDYAGMLLQEAEQMYAADVEAGRTDAERRRRLQDSIDCARQLYAQRAALEGASAAGLLDERIAAAISAASASPFGKDLAAAAGESQDARRNAS